MEKIMTGQLMASPEKLSELSEELKKTIPRISDVLAEKEEQIRSTDRRIAAALDFWKKKRSFAQEVLNAERQACLLAAEQEDDDSFNTCEENLAELEAECIWITEKYNGIKRAQEDFTNAAIIYRNNMGYLQQRYIIVQQQSAYTLEEYALLLKRAEWILGSAPEEDLGTARKTVWNEKPADLPVVSLRTTQQIWSTDEEGDRIFNTPAETGKKLDALQGKIKNFLGTCGLVSCVNVLRLAGIPADESGVLFYASHTWDRSKKRLCTVGSVPDCNGGTTAKSRMEILRHFGICSRLVKPSVKAIADAVSEGRGVIVSVYSKRLYTNRYDSGILHAITVTSVKKDKNGDILGFYVCDSGRRYGGCAKYYPAEQLERALSGREMNVTSIIR